jgi:hypothetical protein
VLSCSFDREEADFLSRPEWHGPCNDKGQIAFLVVSALGGSVERESKSWLAVLSFCATVATVVAFALALLVASATIAFALGNRLESPAPEADAVVVLAQPAPAGADITDQAAELPPATPKTPGPR